MKETLTPHNSLTQKQMKVLLFQNIFTSHPIMSPTIFMNSLWHNRLSKYFFISLRFISLPFQQLQKPFIPFFNQLSPYIYNSHTDKCKLNSKCKTLFTINNT